MQAKGNYIKLEKLQNLLNLNIKLNKKNKQKETDKQINKLVKS